MPGGIETAMTASRPVWSRTITYRSDQAGFASRQSCFTALSPLASSERLEEVKPLSKSGRSALRRIKTAVEASSLLCVLNVIDRSLDGVLTGTGHTLGVTGRC